MTIPRLILLTAMVAAASASTVNAADRLLPDEVANFIDRREMCDLFRGQDAYDAERRRFLIDAVNGLCTGTDKELKRLREKYREDQDVLQRLAEYEPDIEGSIRNAPEVKKPAGSGR